MLRGSHDVFAVLRQVAEHAHDRVSVARVARALVEGVDRAVDVAPVVRQPVVLRRERCGVDRVVEQAVGIGGFEDAVEHARDDRPPLRGARRLAIVLERVLKHEADDQLVAVVAQAQRAVARVRREVPLAARHAVAAGQHLVDVRVGDAAAPFEEAIVAGHQRQPRQHLQVVAVELGVGGRQLAESRVDRRRRHGVGDHVHHPGVPRRPAQVLGDGDQPVLGVLAGAKQARGPRARPVSRFSAPGTPPCEEVVYRTSLRNISSRRPSSRSGWVRCAVRIRYGYRSAPELCGVYSRVRLPGGPSAARARSAGRAATASCGSAAWPATRAARGRRRRRHARTASAAAPSASATCAGTAPTVRGERDDDGRDRDACNGRHSTRRGMR